MNGTGNRESAKIVCRNVWKIFGPHPERLRANLDASANRDEVQERTGHVIAVRDVTFQVNEGRDLRRHGAFRFRQVDSGALHLAADRADERRGADRRPRRRRNDRGGVDGDETPPDEHGVPAFRPLLAPNGSGQCHLRTGGAGSRPGTAHGQGDGGARPGGPFRVGEQLPPRSSRGGCSSAWGWRGRWRWIPRSLVFDEPFSALDPLIRREMQDELLGLQAAMKKTMVFITHDFLEAIKMGDHIAVMKDGEDSADRHAGGDRGRSGRRLCSRVHRRRPAAQGVERGQGDAVPGVAGRRGSDSVRGRRVSAGTKLDRLMDRIADTDAALPVVDSEDRIVGEIDRGIVMRALSEREEAESAVGRAAAR